MMITVGSKVKDREGNTYTLKEKIGHGGFGNVYKAINDTNKKIYAVKLLLIEGEKELNSFKNEIALLSEVNGKHVIQYVYAHDGEQYVELPPYIIMEYADGGTLAEQIKERKEKGNPYSKEELIDLFFQLVDGMK